MALAQPSDFGMCPCGGALFERRAVEVRMTVGDDQVVLTDVAQGACPVCGSRVYKAAVLESIEALMHGRPAPPVRAAHSI